MDLIDRRGFARGILFGAAVAAAGLAVSPGTVSAMPLDDRVPGPSTIGSRRLRRSSSLRVRAVAIFAAIGAASGVAGGVEAAASAVGADIIQLIVFVI
jgi:hypothetical protein